MPYLDEINPKTGHLDAGIVRERGLELADSYRSVSPFPHVVIDDFLPPEMLDMVLAHFPASEQAAETYDRSQERRKAGHNPDELAPELRNLFYAFNSRPFIKIVENISGIKGLIGDPYFIGGGLHEIAQGGHLSIHADFNHHPPLNLERRINVLIYLNRGWKDEWGGQLELWENDMSKCVMSCTPEFNRCVIFNTTSNSYHGNPHPIAHPDGIPRRSIALYYYTATWDGSKRNHNTQFRARRATADKPDYRIRATELASDLLPPLLFRWARKLKTRISA